MINIPCVIFAGGKSSRMGEDKSLLPFGSYSTLIEFQLNKFSKIFKTVYISCKDKNKFDFEARFIEDIKTSPIFAPTAGFVAVYENIEEDAFFAISVDTPFISELEINKILIMDSEKVDATIAKTKFSIHPICGIYHRSLKDKFSKMLEDDNHKLNLLLRSSDTVFVEFDDEKKFLNLNHPHEYQEALKLV